MSVLDQVVGFVKVIASTVAGDNSETTYNVTGISGYRLAPDGSVLEGSGDDGDDAGEQGHEQEAYQGLGILGRPLAPDGELYAEAVALRTEDGLLPFGWRDLRLSRAVNPSGSQGTPAEGQLLFGGYGGAFLSHAMAASGDANISTWYVPFDPDGDGVPQKAHTISIDPTPGNSSIQLVHAEGLFLSLTEDADGAGNPGIVAAVDGSTFVRMSAGELTLNAAKILLKGNCYLGAQAEAGVPLLAGPASPPSPSVFVSPV